MGKTDESWLQGASIARCLTDVESLMLRLAGDNLPCDTIGPIVVEHLRTGGKRLRARLALAASGALGAGLEPAVAWAAACELAHNATLVHDDLQDGDQRRRGAPTTWVRHGMAQAVNAGDLLFMLPQLAIAEVPVATAVRADLSTALAVRLADVIRGQANEWAMTQAGVTDRAAYERAIIGKTSALFELPVQGAALLAGHGAVAARDLAGAFEPLGMLFQMQDDVLDLYGAKGREAVGSDLREGKISALVVEHLSIQPNDRDWLLAILRAEREVTSDAAVDAVIERFRAAGALQAVLGRIRELADAVRADVRLEAVPHLRQLGDELVALVLRPIEHLFFHE